MSTTVSLVNLTDGAVLGEDELVARARQGDRTAFGALYLRHRDAARRVAGMCTASAADAEDAVAEGFAKVFAALPRMAGRPIAFRAYLLTCVRNAATDRLRRERRIDLRDNVPEDRMVVESPADDTALAGLERSLVGEALQALPLRWRTVLWLTEVEGMTPAQVSSRIGIKPNAVAALAYRARRGLRDAYLQAHLRHETTEGCRATVGRLGVFVRGELAERERDLVEAHLDDCEKCRSRRDELTDVNSTIRAAFLPVPLLLAGMKGRWLETLGRAALFGRSPVEAAQLGAMGDSPMVHKAVAGLAALVMAVSAHGTSRLLGDEGAARAPQAVTMRDTRSAIDFSVLPSDPLGGRHAGQGYIAEAEPAPVAGTPVAVVETAPRTTAGAVTRPTSSAPASRSVSNGNQSRFGGWNGDDSGQDPAGDQWLGGGEGADPVLADPDSLVTTVVEALPLEVVTDVLASLPLLGGSTSSTSSSGTTAPGPEASVEAPDEGDGGVLAGPVNVVEGLIEEVPGLSPLGSLLEEAGELLGGEDGLVGRLTGAGPLGTSH